MRRMWRTIRKDDDEDDKDDKDEKADDRSMRVDARVVEEEAVGEGASDGSKLCLHVRE